MSELPPPGRTDRRLLFLIPAATLLFHLLTLEGYGIFRDEMYYLACGAHLDWGYVDHPPLVALIAAIVRNTLGQSVPATRFLPAVAAALTVWVAMRIARDVGGGAFALGVTGLATALCPVYVSLFAIFSMNAFDVLFWALLYWILVRLLESGDTRLWILFGAVAGVTLLNKINVLFLAAGIGAGLVVTQRFRLLVSRGFLAGAILAALVFLPHVLWQVAHGWPTVEFMENARRNKMLALSPVAFLAEAGLQAGPALLPVVLAGLIFLITSRAARKQAPLGWSFLVILAAMIASQAKAYYLAPALAVLFAGGGVALERKIRRPPLRAALLAFLLLGSLLLLPLAKPLLPVDTFVVYAKRLGVAPSTGERHEMGRLPQFFADMHGWRDLAKTVSGVYHSLPAEEQSEVAIFGQNYGEAGAIDYFAKEFGLPGAISGHNSYWMWGPGRATGDVMIVIGDDREVLEGLFEQVELGATFHCTDCMPYENDLPIWVVRRLRQPMETLWPEVRHYI